MGIDRDGREPAVPVSSTVKTVLKRRLFGWALTALPAQRKI